MHTVLYGVRARAASARRPARHISVAHCQRAVAVGQSRLGALRCVHFGACLFWSWQLHLPTALGCCCGAACVRATEVRVINHSLRA
jgi:hypothetical protein